MTTHADQLLVTELEKLLKTTKRQLADLEGEDRDLAVFKQSRPLVAALATHPLFHSGRCVYFATKPLRLYPEAAGGLLRVALERDAESAVAWMHRLFEVDRADIRIVAELHGLEVQKPVALANRVRLLPFNDAPDSPNFRALQWRYIANFRSPLEFVWPALPSIAVYDISSVSVSNDGLGNKDKHEGARRAIADAARAFTLADRAAPVVGHVWTEFAEPELMWAEAGRTWSIARFEGPIADEQLKVDDEALAWTERYFLLDEQSRGSVEIALDRLNLARRRRSPGDRAIDGGICLEALLGDDSSTELTYKLQVRAALLLGGDIAERQRIRQIVKDFYTVRSKVVHGRARKPKDSLPDERRASEGLEICTRAVRAFVQRKSRPDFAVWELTGGPQDAGTA
jgi:hypothetical protein